MVGLQVREGPDKGMRIKKPSSMTASCAELVYPFQNLRCNRRHKHLDMMGQSNHLKSAETWTWPEANLILEGIKMLLKTSRTGRTSERIYPVIKALIPRVRRLGIEVARATPQVYHKRAMTTERRLKKSHLALVADMEEPMMTGHTPGK